MKNTKFKTKQKKQVSHALDPEEKNKYPSKTGHMISLSNQESVASFPQV